MNRTLKIFLVVGLSGLLLLALMALVFFKYVSDHKDDWLAKGRETLQEGVEAGKTMRDVECFDEAVARHRDGRDGFAGMGARFWFKGCLQSATPTDAFCLGVAKSTDIVDSIRWQTTMCTKHGLTGQSECGGTVREIQAVCDVR